jgi:glycosyltransferase involved in cell wall biosynthesis
VTEPCVIGTPPTGGGDSQPGALRARTDRPLPGILQVVLSLSPGGAERLAIEMSKHIAARGRVSVCCLDEPGAWAAELEGQGIPIVALGRKPGFKPSIATRIGEVARRMDAAVLHCHQFSPFVYGSLAALGNSRLRVVYTEHGRLSDAPPSRKRRMVNRLLGRIPAAICAVSTELRAHMIAEGVPAGAVEVVHNGIVPGRASSDRDRRLARDLLSLGPDRFVVGTAARLDPVKDLRTLLEAFAAFRSATRAALIIVGDGPEREALRQAARDAGVADAVNFLGHRSDVRTLLPAFDLFVNCSRSEGVSLTILEAMAAGLPVVATHVGGNPELVIDNVSGLLVPPGDPASLARAMDRVAADLRLARRLGTAGRQRLVDHFSFDGMMSRYFAIYREMSAGSAFPRRRAPIPARRLQER